MSVEYELSELITNVSNAYGALSELGAEIPENKNLENLTGTINTVPKGTSLAPALMEGATRIEDTIGDITNLREYAFYGNSSLEEVILPACSSFPSTAFSNCSNLKSLYLGGVSVAESNQYTATNFPILETLVLPNCTSLANYAFMSCTTLKNISIPNVTSVPYSAFYGCIKLETLNIGKCTHIGNYAFAGCKNLQSIDTRYVTSLGSYAFQKCDALTYLEIPNITVLPYGGLAWMSNVSYISLANVTSYASNANTTLSNNYNLKGAYLPKITAFNPYMFESCSSLSSLSDIYAPLVTSIPLSCFRRAGLISINDNQYTSIAYDAFNYCTSLQYVRFNKATCAGGFDYCYSLEEAEFPLAAPASLDSFRSCSALRKITYGVSGGTVGDLAFYDCDNLETFIGSPSYIARGAFSNCSKLRSFDFTNVLTVSSYGFCGTGFTTSITLSKVTTLSSQAFRDIPGPGTFNAPVATGTVGEYCLTSVGYSTINLPLVTSFSSRVCWGCSKLTNISVPSLQYVGREAFMACTKLSEIDLPKVISIGSSAFSGCSSLIKLKIGTSNCTLGKSALYKTPIANSNILGYYGSIYVPKAYLETYKTKASWSFYSSRMVGY